MTRSYKPLFVLKPLGLSYFVLDKRQAERVRIVGVHKHKMPKNSRRFDRHEEYKESKMNGFKWLSAFLLIVLIFFIYQIDHPYTKVARQWVEESMTREFNFKGVYEWYQQTFSGNPAILPTFSIKQKEQEQKFVKPFIKPVKKIKPFSQGILIELSQPDSIVSVEQGLVVSISEEQNLGQTIIIRHKNGIESIYGMLDQLQVEENDWLQPGQAIGTANQNLYFAIRDQSKYLNPMDVIAFEGQN
ncbi:M23 family metallopeptidase [Tepidibacillus fermentans]|uniref:Peptidase M23-like protein n=1 Tax=Tepidibacillus fermentans TaxID=1281767 RepID=A0A4R3K855_9BACI|nr:M23 family metallopeptidase [Tepidibacillus fermentans]TCS79067.1 peptidase M23-like protein [Tepidibacillus fermentans]